MFSFFLNFVVLLSFIVHIIRVDTGGHFTYGQRTTLENTNAKDRLSRKHYQNTTIFCIGTEGLDSKQMLPKTTVL